MPGHAAFRMAMTAAAVAYPVLVTAQAGPESPVVPFVQRPGLTAVDGDFTVPGVPYVLRIHNDSGYVVLPHIHAEIEHIVVISGRWSLALGDRYRPVNLQPMEVGDYAQVPARAPHYGRARTELTIQVHGIGPFYTDYHNPVYRLNRDGVFFEDMAGTLSDRPVSSPPGCFELAVGDEVALGAREGTVLEAQCSPSDSFTQYWIQTAAGRRFWASVEELTVR